MMHNFSFSCYRVFSLKVLEDSKVLGEEKMVLYLRSRSSRSKSLSTERCPLTGASSPPPLLYPSRSSSTEDCPWTWTWSKSSFGWTSNKGIENFSLSFSNVKIIITIHRRRFRHIQRRHFAQIFQRRLSCCYHPSAPFPSTRQWTSIELICILLSRGRLQNLNQHLFSAVRKISIEPQNSPLSTRILDARE